MKHAQRIGTLVLGLSVAACGQIVVPDVDADAMANDASDALPDAGTVHRTA
jgi:hypothetical protein